MKLSDIVNAYMEILPVGSVLDEDQVARHLKESVRFYCGHAALRNHALAADGIHSSIDASNEIDSAQDFDLNPSEYALIKPLWYLYMELENATSLEASRGQGLDVYGRNTSEIRQDIAALELEMPKRAFMEPVVSI